MTSPWSSRPSARTSVRSSRHSAAPSPTSSSWTTGPTRRSPHRRRHAWCGGGSRAGPAPPATPVSPRPTHRSSRSSTPTPPRRAGWLEPLLSCFDDARVALAAPRVTAPSPGPRAGILDRYEAARSPLDLGPVEGRVRARTRVSYVPAAALLARAAAVRGGWRLRRTPAGRRGRGPRLAARRGPLAVSLRAGLHRDARGAPPARVLARAAAPATAGRPRPWPSGTPARWPRPR